VPLCPPQIPHGLTWDRTRASAVCLLHYYTSFYHSFHFTLPHTADIFHKMSLTALTLFLRTQIYVNP
jgi:hypothetical protein